MRPLILPALVLLLALSGCDRKQDKTPDELLAEDTTLAMDLARVNDAMGGGEGDSTLGLTGDALTGMTPEAIAAASVAPTTRDADLHLEPPPPTETPTRTATATRSAPAAPPRSSPAPATARVATRTPAAPTPAPAASPAPRTAPVRLGGPAVAACDSRTAADQQSCLLSLLARYDVGLNAAYRDAIQRLRRAAGVSAGAPDPASVRELRTAQRAWLVYRDQECRRRTRSREGDLWAPVRARCLGELSEVRASVLRAI